MKKVTGMHLSLLVASAYMVGGSSQLLAQDTVSLGTVSKTNTKSSTVTKTESAIYQAPTKSSVKIVEPKSTFSSHYIENNTAATGDFTDIAKLSASVSSIDPNGSGGMEAQALQMRGFQDGQYNMLIDGIPFADSNDFTHHSTSYLTKSDIGEVSVDRGPGTAETVGDATFGGTFAMYSKNPANKASVSPYMTFGSFNTKLFGIQANTGYMKALGMDDTKAFINYSHSSTDGALTNTGQTRDNFMFKTKTALGSNTVMTLFVMYNKIHQYVPVGATKAQIDKYGSNYGLSSDPTSQAYNGYNYDRLETNMEYIGLKSRIGAWKVNNKLYTYAYTHSGYNGEDPNGNTPNGTVYGASNVPGQVMSNNYRSIGDLLRTSRPVPLGTLKLGIWADYQVNTRSKSEVDYTLGGIPNPVSGSIVDNNASDRDMLDTLTSVQPYIEYDIKPISGLTLKPGVRYVSFNRTLSAPVNQKTLKPLTYAQQWTKLLPSFEINYAILKHWSVYAQWAKGFLAPNLNTFYVTDPSKNDISPEQTTNYQLGTVYKTHRLALSVDGYYVDFDNLISHKKVAGETIYYNNGGVIYKGLEAEGTLYVGAGFSVYANGSLNSAKTKDTNQWIANAPKATYAGGLIFNKYNVYASLLAKHVSSVYGDSGETQKIDGYTTTNLNLSYHFKHVAGYFDGAKISFQVHNLSNYKGIVGLAGYTEDNTALYWTAPGREYYASLSLKFK